MTAVYITLMVGYTLGTWAVACVAGRYREDVPNDDILVALSLCWPLVALVVALAAPLILLYYMLRLGQWLLGRGGR